jgi:hypothetical protein
VWDSAPDTDHIQHTKKYTVKARQYARALDDLVDSRKPFHEAVLGARRWLPFAQAQRSNDSDDNINGYSPGGVEVLDQSCDTCLVEIRLDRRELYDISKSVRIKSVLESILADDIDHTRDLDCALLRRRP